MINPTTGSSAAAREPFRRQTIVKLATDLPMGAMLQVETTDHFRGLRSPAA